MSIEVAKLAINLLPQIEVTLSIPDRLKQAAEMACVLLQYSQQGVKQASAQNHANYVKEVEQEYGLPFEVVGKLTQQEREDLALIRERFRRIAGQKSELSADDFLGSVLLQGRKFQSKTLDNAWKGYEKECGVSLRFDFATAMQHGPRFVKTLDERISTWVKSAQRDQARKAGKKGGAGKSCEGKEGAWSDCVKKTAKSACIHNSMPGGW